MMPLHPCVDACRLKEADAEIERLKRIASDMGRIINDLVVANQAAWIEWQHGAGAEAAMRWVHNGLAGPGQIPDEEAEFGKEAQAWFDSNRSDAFPRCYCGRPSSQLWMDKGACCSEHMHEIQKSGGYQH